MLITINIKVELEEEEEILEEAGGYTAKNN
jgi:hypothetical protein